MYVGAAYVDASRTEVPKSCTKNKLMVKRLPDPPDATNSACIICAKAAGFDVWNMICMPCNRLICKTCIDLQRVGHRHLLNWAKIIRMRRLNFQLGQDARCDACDQVYFGNSFCWKAGGRQYEVVVLDVEPKALRGGRYLSTLVCAL